MASSTINSTKPGGTIQPAIETNSHFFPQGDLSIAVDPLTEIVKILRTGLVCDIMERPDRNAILLGDTHSPPFNVRPIRVFPLHDHMVATDPLNPEIPGVAQDRNHVIARKISRNHCR
jgi:hypothetical protein